MVVTKIQLVDEKGLTIGEIEKIAAHENGGTWHRAISVFLFDEHSRLLIQKRTQGKYHFGGLWANSCCSHPTTQETIEQAAVRAMVDELGVKVPVKEVAVVRYEAVDLVSGHTEREHDHILVGHLGIDPIPNPDEVETFRWVTIDDLRAEIEEQPGSFVPWLPIILNQVNYSFSR